MDDSYWWSWYGMWTWMSLITRASVLLMGFMLLCAIYDFLKQVESRHAAVNAAASILETLQHERTVLSESIFAVQSIADQLSAPVVLAGLKAFKFAPNTLADVLAVERSRARDGTARECGRPTRAARAHCARYGDSTRRRWWGFSP